MDSSFARFIRTPAARIGLVGVVCAIGPMLTGGFTGESTAGATTPDPNSIPFIKLRSEVWEIVIRRAGPGRAEVERVWAKCDGEWVNACYPDLDAASRQRALTSTFRESVQLQGDFTYCSRVAIDLPHDMARQLVRPSTSDLCLALKGPGKATIYKPGDPGTMATTQARRGSQALPAAQGTRIYKGGEMPAPQPLALDDGLEGVYTPPAPAPTGPAPDPELDALLGDVPQYESDGAVRRTAPPPSGATATQARVQPGSAGSSPGRTPAARAPAGSPQPLALDDGLEGVYTPPAPAPTGPAPDPELDALLGDVPQYESDGAIRRTAPPPSGATATQARVQPGSAGSSPGRTPAARAPAGSPQPLALDDGLEGVYTPPAPAPTGPAPDPELDALLGDVPQYESDGAIRRTTPPAGSPATQARIQPAPTGSSSGQAPAGRAPAGSPQPLALDDGLEGVYTPPAPAPTGPAPDPELDALLGDVPQYESDGAVRRTTAPRPAPAPAPASSPRTRPTPSAPIAASTRSAAGAPAPGSAPAPEPTKRSRKGRKDREPTELELEEQELQNLAPIRQRDADEDEAPIGVVGPRGRYLIIDIEGLPEDDMVPEREETEWGFDPDAEPQEDGLDL